MGIVRLKIHFKHIISVLLLCVCFHIKVGADTITPSDTVEAWDNSIVNYRQPTNDTISYYRQLEDYNYNSEAETESLLQKLLKWLLSKLVTGGYITWIGWILLTLAVIALLALIIRIFGIPIKGLFVFSRSTKVTELTFSPGDNNIESENLEKLLQTFIQNEALREATRVLFLLALRQLHRAEIIRWNAGKTDREYYYEIEDAVLKAKFLDVMRQYEYIWYGKYNPQQEHFHQLNNLFDQLAIHIDAVKNNHE